MKSGAATLWTRLEGGASNKTPLLFVHGGPGMTSFPFEETVGPRIAKRRPVIYADYRGAGRSTRPKGASNYSFDILADDVERIRAAYGYERIAVLGHSNGAATTLTFARRHGPRAAAIVLLCPLISPADLEVNVLKKATRSPPAVQAKMRALLASDAPIGERFVGALELVPPEVMHGIQFADPKNQLAFDRMMTKLKATTGMASMMTPDLIAGMRAAGFFEFDAYAFAAELKMPVLVVSGTHDSETSVENAMRFSVEVPRGRFLEMKASGHHPFVEEPEALAAGIEAFLVEQGL